MNLIVMMDELLRNRQALYRTAAEGKGLRGLCVRLLLLFLVASAIYGAVMGAYRSMHPDYYYSDFEITDAHGVRARGEVAGMMAEQKAVYTHSTLPALGTDATIRFNVTDPSDAYRVSSIVDEKGYRKIILASDAPLMEDGRWLFPLTVALKMPLLFLLTLFVCSLALYILNLAFGMKLHFLPSMTLMLFALAGTSVMLVVFAPITLLFSVVTTSYHFMKILHVAVLVIAGLFGVKVLGEGLVSMQDLGDEVTSPEETRRRVRPVLLSWLVLYCLVGAQVAWMLKPFLGTPYLPATPPFRLERGNIFVSTFGSMQDVGTSERGAGE